MKPFQLVDLKSSDAAKATAVLHHLSAAIRAKYVSMARFYGNGGADLAIVVEVFRTIRITEISIEVFPRLPGLVSPQVARIQPEDLPLIARMLAGRARDRNLIPVLYVCSAGVSVRHVDRLSLVQGGAA